MTSVVPLKAREKKKSHAVPHEVISQQSSNDHL